MMTRASTISVQSFFPRVLSLPSTSTARLVEALPTFLGSVAASSTQNAIASAIATGLVDDLHAVKAGVYFADTDERTLRLVASHGTQPALLDMIDISTSVPAARAARTRALQLVDQTTGMVARSSSPVSLARGNKTSTAFAFPLVAGDRVLGVVSGEIFGRLEPRDLEALEQLGSILGAMLDRARLADELHGREEWMRVVAHEIRQPLTMILMHAASLARVVADGTSVRSAKHVIAGVHRLNRLVGDLADTTLGDIAKVPLKVRPTDLRLLAEGVAGPGEEGRPARVRVEVRGDVPEVDVDPERIQQVLSNLVANAMKYGKSSAPIALCIERARGRDAVVLSVTNEGKPIPPQEQALIFDRYYRAHRSAAIGWGIGLYVCRGLVEAHGGRISVESNDAKTTFTVELPIEAEQHSPVSCTRSR